MSGLVENAYDLIAKNAAATPICRCGQKRLCTEYKFDVEEPMQLVFTYFCPHCYSKTIDVYSKNLLVGMAANE